MAQYLVNAARTFIFSTALPPPAVAGALAALDLLSERPRLVAKLARQRDRAASSGSSRRASTSASSRTQIVPLVIGEAQRAMRICEAALSGGVFAQAIRPPTVPDMTSRLRLAVMATHHEEELRAAARTLGAAARSVGFDPRSSAAREIVSESSELEFDDGFEDDEDVELPPLRAPRTGVFDFEASEPVRRAA